MTNSSKYDNLTSEKGILAVFSGYLILFRKALVCDTMEEKVNYVCSVCGYVHEGSLDSEPDDYVCPVCGVGKDSFERQ